MCRICCFCETWASGGIESFLTNVLLHMDRSNIEVDIVTVQIMESPFTSRLKEQGLTIHQLSGSKKRWISNCILFWKLLKTNQYDVVHLNVFQGLQLVYLQLAKWAGVPVRIAHSHGSGLRKSKLRWCKLLLHKLGKTCFGSAATLRWTCSQQAESFLFGENAAELIPNGIDVERYRFRADDRERVRKELGLTGKFVIGSVGRLQFDKNQSFLLDVLAQMLPERPDAVLLLVGDGPARQELRDKAKKLGVAQSVIFYGVSDRVEELLWAMDVFAFPSLSEGFGLVAVEAQAAGLPVICSEYIPEEVNLTPYFVCIPLTSGIEVWAKAIMQAETVSRKDAPEIVRQAGFELSGVSDRVRTRYVNNYYEKICGKERCK